MAKTELCVSLVDDAEIKRLNKKYKGKNRATDVLAFPQDDPSEIGRITPHLLGDVVVSVDTAARQAEEEGHSLHRELEILIAHGILHLIGYNDDTEHNRAKMFRKTEEILGSSNR